MSGALDYKQRHAERIEAYNRALAIVEDNESLISPQTALFLQEKILGKFMAGELYDLVQRFHDPEGISPTPFGDIPGRRK